MTGFPAGPIGAAWRAGEVAGVEPLGRLGRN